MTVEKTKPKQLLRPITTGAGSAMNQSQFLAITCNSLEAREKSRVCGGIGFGFASHWLKNWRESFKSITKRSNRNHVITFDSHMKTALYKKKTKVKETDAGLEWPTSWRTNTLCLTPVLPRPFCSHAVETYISQTVLFARSIVRNYILYGSWSSLSRCGRCYYGWACSKASFVCSST